MKFRKIAAFMVGASLLAGVPGSAAAQEYYARERVVNLKGVSSEAETFEWSAGEWSEWSSRCSEEAVRTRDVNCVSSTGGIVADASCSNDRPASSETAEMMDQCPPPPPARCYSGIVKTTSLAGSPVSGTRGFSFGSVGQTQSGLSVWVIHNTNDVSHYVSLRRSGGAMNLTIPAKTEAYVMSNVGALSHTLWVLHNNQVIFDETAAPSASLYAECL